MIPNYPDISIQIAISPSPWWAFDDSVSHSFVVHLELVFCRRTFRDQFLLVDQPWGILGRNVLNAVPLLLEAPRLTWYEHAGPARTT
jgi:hypothetical protein